VRFDYVRQAHELSKDVEIDSAFTQLHLPKSPVEDKETIIAVVLLFILAPQ